MNEERDYIYLKGTEELGDVIDALRKINAPEIIIVVPRRTKCFLNYTNLDILKNEIKKLNKKVYIDSDDEQIINLAKEQGINIFLSEYNVEEINRIVTDILPPQKTKPKVTKRVSEEKIKLTSAFDDYDLTKKTKQKRKRVNLSLVFLILVFVGGIFYFLFSLKFGYVTVVLSLQKQPLPFEDYLVLNPNITSPVVEENSIPAEYIEISKNISIRQKTSGSRSGSNLPTGKVKIINKDKENSISIIANTRLIASNGNEYKLLERVSLGPGEEKEVVIVAKENDQKYYLTDTNVIFNIPGLKGTSWEDKIEVKLTEPVRGSGDKVNYVTLNDISEGKIKLEKELEKAISDELKNKYKDYVFPEEKGDFQIKQPEVSHQVGQVTDEIALTGSASLKTVGVKYSQLVNYIKDIIAKENLKKDSDYRILDFKLDRLTINNFDPKTKIMTVLAKGNITIESRVNEKEIILAIAGKDIEEVKEIIGKMSNITNAKLILNPSWLKKIPENLDKIKIKIE
jgi:hypothetical protein